MVGWSTCNLAGLRLAGFFGALARFNFALAAASLLSHVIAGFWPGKLNSVGGHNGFRVPGSSFCSAERSLCAARETLHSFQPDRCVNSNSVLSQQLLLRALVVCFLPVAIVKHPFYTALSQVPAQQRSTHL